MRIGLARTDLDIFEKFWTNILCAGIELSSRQVYFNSRKGRASNRETGPEFFKPGCIVRLVLEQSGEMLVVVGDADLGVICTVPTDMPMGVRWELAVSTYSKRAKITVLCFGTDCK
jgi:hypothetical protein